MGVGRREYGKDNSTAVLRQQVRQVTIPGADGFFTCV